MKRVSTRLSLSHSSQDLSNKRCVISLALCKMSHLLKHRTHKSRMITFGKWAWLMYWHEVWWRIRASDGNSTTQCLYTCSANLKGQATFSLYHFEMMSNSLSLSWEHMYVHMRVNLSCKCQHSDSLYLVFFFHTIPTSVCFFFSMCPMNESYFRLKSVNSKAYTDPA